MEVVLLDILDAHIEVVAYGRLNQVGPPQDRPLTHSERSDRDFLVHEEGRIYDEEGDVLISVQLSIPSHDFSSLIGTSVLFSAKYAEK